MGWIFTRGCLSGEDGLRASNLYLEGRIVSVLSPVRCECQDVWGNFPDWRTCSLLRTLGCLAVDH
jgi:hypothetical protein